MSQRFRREDGRLALDADLVVATMAAFVFMGVRMPGELAKVAGDLLTFTTVHFGWLCLFVITGFCRST